MTAENFGFVPDAPVASASAPENFGFVPDAPSQQTSGLQGFINKYGQSVLGAGDAIRNTLASAANILPGVNISPVQSGNNPGYDFGKFAGNIGAFVGGGDVLDAGRALYEGAPLVGQLASSLGGQRLAASVGRRALGSAIYGGLANNQGRGENAAIGAGLSAATDILPPALGASAEYLMPQRYAQGIIKGLGGGQTLADATKSVLSSVKNAYDTQVENAKNVYSSIFSRVPSGSIYAPVKRVYGIPTVAPTNTSIVSKSYTPLNYEVNTGSSSLSNLLSGKDNSINEPVGKSISSNIRASGKQNPASFLEGSYPSLSSNVINSYSPSLKDLHENFIDNPTFQNAHKLQSELGSVGSQLKNGITAPTPSTVDDIKNLGNARSALKGDINTFLTNKDPELAQEYKKASDDFQQDVVPYRTNPKIYSIATGDTTNVQPSSLATIFKSPNSDMQKVLGDLPEGTVDKILFTKLGQTVPNKSAQGLLNSAQNLDQQGLGEYVSPNLKFQLGDLENRIKARNGVQMATAALSGAALGSHYGGATAGALLGGMSGAIASPFMNYIGKRLPIDDIMKSNISNAIGNVIRGTYPVGRSVALANYLNNSGVQNGS